MKDIEAFVKNENAERRKVSLSWNFKQSMGARNRVGTGLSYRPARLHRLAESILGLLKSLKIRAQEKKTYFCFFQRELKRNEGQVVFVPLIFLKRGRWSMV
jgi:hypothetical protein